MMAHSKRLGMAASAVVAGLFIGSMSSTTPVWAANPEAVGVENVEAAKVVSLGLLKAVEEAKNKNVSFATSLKNIPIEKSKSGDQFRVVVIFEKNAAKSFKSVKINGLKVLSLSETYDRGLVEISDPDAVLALAKTPGVRMVKPHYGLVTRTGIVDGRASEAHWADVARDRYLLDGKPVDGSGVKVGIISDSFAATTGVVDGNTTLDSEGILRGARNQKTGDLPPEVQILKDYAFGSDEGAGMGELIYDLAPGVDMAFHTAVSEESVFADGIRRLWQEAGCDIIVDDVGYLNEPFYQDGIIAAAAGEATRNGVAFFSAAGNDANFGLRQKFRDSHPEDDRANPPSGKDFHLWDNDDTFLEVTLPPYGSMTIFLQWNQPWQSLNADKGSRIDMDLLFYDSKSVYSTFRGSRGWQGETAFGYGDPVEAYTLVNANDSFVTTYMAIDHWAGNQDTILQSPDIPVEFRLFFMGDGIVEGIEDGSSRYGGITQWGHTYARDAVSVGAVPWYDTPNFDTTFLPSILMDPEDFSSRGGEVAIYFDVDGNLINRRSFEPDIAAVDGNNTTFFGQYISLGGYEGEPDAYPNFFGTSAAAPNAAAIAALMLQLNPKLTPRDITSIMQATAYDVAGGRAAPGWDDVTGAGLINAVRALDETARRAGREPIVSPTPTPAPAEPVLFSFDSDPIQWTFEAIPEVFTVPFSGYKDGSILMQSRDNVNSFGYMKSPRIVENDWRTFGDVSIGPPPDSTVPPDEYLYRVAYSVKSDRPTTDIQRVPVMRMRMSTDNFEQSSLVVVSSTRTPNVVPGRSPKTYYQYFQLPEGKDAFRLYFELLNTGGFDAPDGSLLLDQVRVDIVDMRALRNQEPETEFDFQGQDNLWIYATVDEPKFDSPESGVTPRGLRLGPSSPRPGIESVFGVWQSPSDFGAPGVRNRIVNLSGGRLYRAMFVVDSTAKNQAEAERLPTFRFRLNDSTLNYSALLNVESIPGSSNLPTEAAPKEYSLWFTGRQEIENSELLWAFDYLFVPGVGNDPGKSVFLKSLRVDSFAVPDL